MLQAPHLTSLMLAERLRWTLRAPLAERMRRTLPSEPMLQLRRPPPPALAGRLLRSLLSEPALELHRPLPARRIAPPCEQLSHQESWLLTSRCDISKAGDRRGRTMPR